MALVDQIIGTESGWNATARNPRSSATGLGQFIDSTWLATIAKHRPDLAGLPRDQILDLRTNPTLSRQMTQAYADDNGAILRKAGFEATPGNTYLAHFAGPGGATSVLGADPDTPVSAVLPASSIAANPFLKGMSAGDLTAWAARKVGDKAPTMSMPGAVAASTAPGAFGLTGPVAAGTPESVTPAGGATMQAPAKDDGIDVSKLLAALTGSTPGATAQPQAQPAAPPPMQMPQPQRHIAAFDPSAFYALLRGKR